MNSKLSARFHFVRASVSSGFRAPTPGQQNGFNISTIFDPALGDLVNNGTIPSISPVAALRGGQPLAPEQSINYTAGVVFDTGQFTFTANYFRINVSDRIGITSNFTLTADEIDTLLADGVDAARDLRQFRFFTNAFATASQGIDLVSTFTDASESHLTVGLYVLVSALCSEIWVYPGFPTLFWGLSGFFVNDLMGKALWSSWKTRSVFQGAVGAFCASTAPSASTGPICMRQDRRVLGLQSTRE